MTREELEHIIRASATVTNQYEFVIVGSQSILGSVPHPEEVFTVSAEADIYPLHAPELAEKIEGALGEGSHFHETHGYYAQGVGPETAVLPAGWMSRVHRVQTETTNGRVGYCLEVTDLFMSKAVAGREKDRLFCIALWCDGPQMRASRSISTYLGTFSGGRSSQVAAGMPFSALAIRPMARSNWLSQKLRDFSP